MWRSLPNPAFLPTNNITPRWRVIRYEGESPTMIEVNLFDHDRFNVLQSELGVKPRVAMSYARIATMDIDLTGTMCNDRDVDRAAVIMYAKAESGWGPLLYDFAALVCNQFNLPLVSDRMSVSEDATRIWQYYQDKRRDVQVVPTDKWSNCAAYKPHIPNFGFTVTPEQFEARWGDDPWMYIENTLWKKRAAKMKDLEVEVELLNVKGKIPQLAMAYEGTSPTRAPSSKRARENTSRKVGRPTYDEEGHLIPEKYLAGLPSELRRARIQELTSSRSGEMGYAELPTDRAARQLGITKKGQYTVEAERRGIEHRGDFGDTAVRALHYYGVDCSTQNANKVAAELRKVFNKGLAAWQTGGHRPGASQRAWGYARVASVLTGGKAAYTADRKNVAAFPPQLSAAIHAQRLYRG